MTQGRRTVAFGRRQASRNVFTVLGGPRCRGLFLSRWDMRTLRLIPVLAFGVSVLLIIQGLLGILAPDVFVGVIRLFQSPPMIYVAAALRIAIGIVLLCAVTGSRFPMFLRIFGVLVLIGGLLTSFIGVQFAHTILALWSSRGPWLVRLFALASLALGLMALYAVFPKRRST